MKQRRPLPPRCPDSAIQVIEASCEVTAAQKLLWRRIHALDMGEGRCYAAAETLAEDIGTGARNVEKMRGQLLKMGLLANDGGTGRGGARWAATMPKIATPWADRLKREERNRLSTALDAWLRHQREDAESHDAGSSFSPPVSRETYDGNRTIGPEKATTPSVPFTPKGTTLVRPKVRRQFAERYDSSSLEEEIGGLRDHESSHTLERTSDNSLLLGEEERSCERGKTVPAPEHIGAIVAASLKARTG